jgi:hypothetical protein
MRSRGRSRYDDGGSGDEHRQRSAADREKCAEQYDRYRYGGERHRLCSRPANTPAATIDANVTASTTQR